MLVFAMTIGLAAGAWAEGIFPVNDPGTGNWVYDQPSVTSYGNFIHLAFVGDSAAGAGASPNTRLYYAAVDAGADYFNKATTRAQVLITPPVAIENSLFNQARHPQILIRSDTELAILFQAIPSDNPAAGSKLFLALLTIGNNSVTSQRVTEVRDAAGARIPGNLTDPSFALPTTGGTLTAAYSSFPSLVAGSPYSDVYYARVGLDNAQVINTPILLTSTVSSTGVLALPRILLDGNNYSHIVWAANNDDPTNSTPTGIYYAWVYPMPPSVADNLAIGATQVLWGGYRWGFPNVLFSTKGNIWILAADDSSGSNGLAGSVGISEVAPYNVTPDGNPVNISNTESNTEFFINPPGGTVLPSNFDVYHPEAILDLQNRLNVAGYGFRYPDGHGTPGRYYVTAYGSSSPGTSVAPVSVGTGDIAFATQLPGDYTRPAFVHYSGKAMQFWSGPDNVVTGARNLYVTSVYSSSDPSNQSGCSVVGDPRRGEAGRIPGTAVLLLPAVLLALRRATRKAFGR